MNCPYCGALLTYQDVVCPYCGRKHKEGVAFQKEVYDRIERNRLLRPFLINKKKPEVLKRVMLRMVFILVFFNMMLITFALGVSWWASEGDKNSPKGRMFSGQYAEEFPYMEDYSFKNFMEQATSCMRYMEKEEFGKMDEGTIDLLVSFGYQALAENTGKEREEMYEIQKAYYVGYWGLSEEELAFLEPDNGSEYTSMFPNIEKKAVAIDAILAKIQEVAEWE
jgi:hypothetical protein